MSPTKLMALAAVVLACGCESPTGRLEAGVGTVTIIPGTPPIDLRADVNRNGVIDLELDTEDANEDTWDETHGAIFLANIDDDSGRCRGTDAAGRPLSDLALPTCNDATDEIVNGDDDAADLAPLAIKAWPQAPAGTVVRLLIDQNVADTVRLFRHSGDAYQVLDPALPLALADLQAGLSISIEAKDIIRDSATWDGTVDLTLQVVVPEQKYWKPGTYSDTVRLRVAPVLTFHHLLPVESAYASAVQRDPDSAQFVTDLRAAVAAASPNMTLVTPAVEDQWTQDFFETGYTSMPGPNGAQRVMRVFLRSANIENPFDRNYPMRAAGRIVFTRFRGKDVAGIQQIDLRSDYETQSLNSMGNFETIPPYTQGARTWALGRVLRGSVRGFAPDQSFVSMTESQKYQEPSVNIDTSWLLVGHVDETVTFLKANTPRGWIMLANDARLAKQMLEAEVMRGNGATRMFVGKRWIDEMGNEPPAETTISRMLANADVMQASAEAAVKVDEQVAILKRETGITDAEIIKVPFLHEDVQGTSLAHQVGTVNLFVIDDKTLAVADPHGPIIDGKDLFKKQLEDALAPYGYTIRFIDDWNLYHRQAGEVHCATNAMRAIPSTKWWEVKP
ncbi:MAG: protein-arginine deiminase family protein [Myxococcales bacterium]|nr:protein-arginine deiminase family protein [Myxococcales bacterium]